MRRIQFLQRGRSGNGEALAAVRSGRCNDCDHIARLMGALKKRRARISVDDCHYGQNRMPRFLAPRLHAASD